MYNGPGIVPEYVWRFYFSPYYICRKYLRIFPVPLDDRMTWPMSIPTIILRLFFVRFRQSCEHLDSLALIHKDSRLSNFCQARPTKFPQSSFFFSDPLVTGTMTILVGLMCSHVLLHQLEVIFSPRKIQSRRISSYLPLQTSTTSHRNPGLLSQN